jgi:hydrogenase maturation protease
MPNRILIIGYGNPGRQDDGLGPACAEAVQAMALPDVTVDSDYQLTVEDAAMVAAHERVVFVDAAVSGAGPFAWQKVLPTEAASFTTHSVEPGAVVTLARDLFGWIPKAYVLAIRGYQFNEFGEGLSEAARENLAAALAFLRSCVESNRYDFAVGGEVTLRDAGALTVALADLN